MLSLKSFLIGINSSSVDLKKEAQSIFQTPSLSSVNSFNECNIVYMQAATLVVFGSIMENNTR